jgi:hypothetical protein
MPQTLTAVDYATHRFGNGSPQSFRRPGKGTTRQVRADETIMQNHLGTTSIKTIRLYSWLVNGLRAICPGSIRAGFRRGFSYRPGRHISKDAKRLPKDWQKIGKKLAERPVLG